MTRFRLPEAYNVDAKKLAKAIRKDQKIQANPDTFDVIFYPPQEVEVIGIEEADMGMIAALVSKHRPNTSIWRKIAERLGIVP